MKSIYLQLQLNIKKHGLYIFLGLLVFTSIISTTLYNNSKKKIIKEYENLIENIYFKQTVNNLFASTKPRFLGVEHVVKSGESLNSILSSYEIEKNQIKEIIDKLSKKLSTKILDIGLKINFIIDREDNKIIELIYPTSRVKKIILTSNKEGKFDVKEFVTQLDKKLIYKEGTIISSLYKAAINLNIEDRIIVDMANLYGFQIDFQRDIYKNDAFQILYEKFVNEEEKITEIGNIIYANLILRGQNNVLYYFNDKNDSAGHYDRSGASVKKALMKTPINGARLSSPFGMRKHPILGFNKMHRGTDFAAPTGTPVMASGDGIILKARWCGGGGNCVKIKHNSTYQTVYAHLSKFGKGIKKGTRVKQGRIIGYVGSTGMSTGPHLHYEVIKNGKKINSQTLKLPSGKILKSKERERFEIARIKIDVLRSEIIASEN